MLIKISLVSSLLDYSLTDLIWPALLVELFFDNKLVAFKGWEKAFLCIFFAQIFYAYASGGGVEWLKSLFLIVTLCSS